MNVVTMRTDNDGFGEEYDDVCEPETDMRDGICDHLQEMILEVQQLALRLGAGNVAAALQAAYLEARLINRPAVPNDSD